MKVSFKGADTSYRARASDQTGDSKSSHKRTAATTSPVVGMPKDNKPFFRPLPQTQVDRLTGTGVDDEGIPEGTLFTGGFPHLLTKNFASCAKKICGATYHYHELAEKPKRPALMGAARRLAQKHKLCKPSRVALCSLPSVSMCQETYPDFPHFHMSPKKKADKTLETLEEKVLSAQSELQRLRIIEEERNLSSYHEDVIPSYLIDHPSDEVMDTPSQPCPILPPNSSGANTTSGELSEFTGDEDDPHVISIDELLEISRKTLSKAPDVYLVGVPSTNPYWEKHGQEILDKIFLRNPRKRFNDDIYSTSSDEPMDMDFESIESESISNDPPPSLNDDISVLSDPLSIPFNEVLTIASDRAVAENNGDDFSDVSYDSGNLYQDKFTRKKVTIYLQTKGEIVNDLNIADYFYYKFRDLLNFFLYQKPDVVPRNNNSETNVIDPVQIAQQDINYRPVFLANYFFRNFTVTREFTANHIDEMYNGSVSLHIFDKLADSLLRRCGTISTGSFNGEVYAWSMSRVRDAAMAESPDYFSAVYIRYTINTCAYVVNQLAIINSISASVTPSSSIGCMRRRFMSQNHYQGMDFQ